VKTPKTKRRRSLESYGGWFKVHRDQAPYHSHYFDRCFSAVYTPEGIQDLESEYIKRILAFSGKEKDRAELAKEISKNRHLHYAIRRNLIDNLMER
jgi:hypothetical protein